MTRIPTGHDDEEETIRTPIGGLLANEVQSIAIVLDRLPESPRLRELRGRLGTYERVLAGGERSSLPQAQRWALLELLSLLRQQAQEYACGIGGFAVAR
jgi:hypothetical protein